MAGAGAGRREPVLPTARAFARARVFARARAGLVSSRRELGQAPLSRVLARLHGGQRTLRQCFVAYLDCSRPRTGRSPRPTGSPRFDDPLLRQRLRAVVGVGFVNRSRGLHGSPGHGETGQRRGGSQWRSRVRGRADATRALNVATITMAEMAALSVRSASLPFARPTRSLCKQEVSANSSERARTPGQPFAMQKVVGSSPIIRS
jgi:hypothetical protein